MESHLLFELTYMSTGSIRPLYMANVDWWNHAFSIPRVKGDLQIWLNAFFITSVPTPLREGLLRFLQWRCSSSQEKDLLGGVLDLCLYIVSSSSLEETSKLEGDRFCCTRWSFFFKSSISRCMALSSPCSWVRNLSFENHFHLCGWYAHCLLDSFHELFHIQDWRIHLIDKH